MSYDFPVKVFFLAHWCTSYQSLIFLGFGTLHWMCWAHPFYLLIPPFIFRFGFCAGRCRLVAPSLRRLMLAKIFIIRCFLREILTMCRHATFCPFLQKILKMDGRLPLSERSLHSYMPPFGWLLPSSNIIFDYFF